MIATIGYIAPVYFQLLVLLSPSHGLKFADIPTGLAVIGRVPHLGWAQVFLFAGCLEGKGGFDQCKTGTPGDYGRMASTSRDPAERVHKLAAELATSRLEKMAIIGTIAGKD